MPHCLVIAPVTADLTALRVVFEELDTDITTTTDLLVGAQLATVPLDKFDLAAAVLPAAEPDGLPVSVLAALYLEMGIALGRGLPLIVLAEDTDAELPGIGDAAANAWLIAGVSDEASLRLHLSLFVQVAAMQRHASETGFRRGLTPPLATPARETTAESPTTHALRLEQEVIDLLRDSGALVEEAVRFPHDAGVDAAVVIPGTEQVLGPVLVEVKAQRDLDLARVTRDLAEAVLARGASLGLLVYDGAPRTPRPLGRLPVVVLHIDELRRALPGPALGRWLIDVRNRIVHGLPDDA
ncbi:hypothetical protein I6A60_39145 [Frankia sp. AgB1.9]|uniref:hypothetical protein n=1 Tax=unclassified Frankia TaxID=2632575 RepID=UPI001931E051|nr:MULTISPECIES: hypothetical protein [unclassified Frankia]MBL7491557.1 hypothetical protein [Frankia sp. AgW1.1]MBL7553802.1 hypothetical protein [Frankia sp. AgB1.9]MBL7617902.1 hypothetical protein [Frankia sp. AgB1.8]